MKKLFSESDINSIEEKLKSFEQNTGCDLLLVVTEKSDDYKVALWRFSIISALTIVFIFSLFFEFSHGYYWPVFTLAVLVVVLAILKSKVIAHFILPFTIADGEIERECNEFALSCFYKLGVSQVNHKVTAMIILSVLEKKITILVDQMIKEKVSQLELDEIVKLISDNFKHSQMQKGMLEAIHQLEEKILLDFQGKVSTTIATQLKDHIHFV